jgi:hypothetical protein
VGDIESMVFLEALRQFQFAVGRANILIVHVSLVPVLGSVGEQKTKPTQHSVKVRIAINCELVIVSLFPRCADFPSTVSPLRVVRVSRAGAARAGSVPGPDRVPVRLSAER